jgi:hypothetical protein
MPNGNRRTRRELTRIGKENRPNRQDAENVKRNRQDAKSAKNTKKKMAFATLAPWRFKTPEMATSQLIPSQLDLIAARWSRSRQLVQGLTARSF